MFILAPPCGSWKSRSRPTRGEVRDRRVLGYGCAAGRLDGARHRRGRRGDHQSLHLLRDRRTIARTGAPVFRRHRPVTYNIDPIRIREFVELGCEVRDGALINRKTGGRVRAIMPCTCTGSRRTWTDPGNRPTSWPEGHRGRCPGDRLGIRRRRASAASATSAASRSSRPRTSAPSAMRDCAPPTTRRWPRSSGCCASTAWSEVLSRADRRQFPHRRDPGSGTGRQAQAPGRVARRPAAQRGLYDRAFEAANIGDQVFTPIAVRGYRHIYNQYVVRVPERDRLRPTSPSAAWHGGLLPVPCTCSSASPTWATSRRTAPSRPRAQETLALRSSPSWRAAAAARVDSIAAFVRSL